jgi:hypothetical protein
VSPTTSTRLLAVPLLALPLLALPAEAEPTGPAVSARQPSATWSGRLDPGPACPTLLDSCHEQVLQVSAPAGRLVTVVLDQPLPLEVLAPDGSVVARDNVADPVGGPSESEPGTDGPSDVTFDQLRGGRVAYRVRIATTDLGQGGHSYTASARLGGKALDRDPVCDAAVGTPVLGLDAGQVLPLHVRVLTSPDLLEDVKRGVPVAVEAYRGIGVRLTVSYDLTALPPDGTAQSLRALARARYGGRRPAGVDAVYVANQTFGGGQADCIGGTLHPELGFSAGQVRYSPENVLGEEGTGTVSPGVVLAHEVGHSVGGHHEAGNCVEAVPGQAGAGTSAESRGPCTIMSPVGLTLGRAFGTLERGAIRATLLRRR